MEKSLNICLLDFEKEDREQIISKGFDVYNGSAGTKIEIDFGMHSTSEYCLLNHDFPLNLHEYEVLAINLNCKKIIPFNPKDHKHDNITTNGVLTYKISKPTNIFDSRPKSFSILNDDINEFIKQKSIIIVFASEKYDYTYKPVYIGENGIENLEKSRISNYSFWPGILLGNTKCGTKFEIVAENSELKSLLKSIGKIEYCQIFEHGSIRSEEDNKYIKNPHFYPLIKNLNNEIISFGHLYTNTFLLVLPDISNKGEFICKFLTESVPRILPSFLPNSSTFAWLDNENYWLPGFKSLVFKKKEAKDSYEKQIKNIENLIESNSASYQFLHDIISETGEKLVDAVLYLLKWLDFENAQKIDDEKDDGLFEEDIRIEVDGKLLVIEVKGIAGTSKDRECSQISKVKLRRMKERGSFDVFGLYIVNHERFKPPHLRNNPPFNDVQIQDALNDERGLLTTYELYKLYYDIENEVFTKSEIKNHFLNFGLVNFRSSLTKVGKVDKTFKENSIASVELDNIEISVGDELISEKDGMLLKHKIISMQRDRREIESVSEGRIGICLDNKIENNSILYKK